jgi:ribonuclease HI
LNPIEVFIDGGCRGNPGKGAFGFVIRDHNGELIRHGEKLSQCTNNSAEYRALIEALQYLVDNDLYGKEGVTIYSDSELLVNQMNRRYRVRSRNLLPLYSEAKRLAERFGSIRIKHISRNKNRIADWVVNRIFDNKAISQDQAVSSE